MHQAAQLLVICCYSNHNLQSFVNSYGWAKLLLYGIDYGPSLYCCLVYASYNFKI